MLRGIQTLEPLVKLPFPHIFSCLPTDRFRLTEEDPPFLFDYFYPDDDELGNCPCGLARKAASVVIRKAGPDKFLDSTWLNSIVSFAGNPSAVGSMVERSCISAISTFGLDRRDNLLKSLYFKVPISFISSR